MTVSTRFAELARRREEASLAARLESFKTTGDNAARVCQEEPEHAPTITGEPDLLNGQLADEQAAAEHLESSR